MSRGATGFGRFSRWLTNRRAVTIAPVAAIGVHTLALASLPLIVTPDGQQYLTQAALYLGHQVPGQTFRYGANGRRGRRATQDEIAGRPLL